MTQRLTLPATVAAALEEAAIERERNAKQTRTDAAHSTPAAAAYLNRCADVDIQIAGELRAFLAQHDVEQVEGLTEDFTLTFPAHVLSAVLP